MQCLANISIIACSKRSTIFQLPRIQFQWSLWTISSFEYISYLVIQRTQARVLPVAESETQFSDLATHLPKVVLAGGSIDSLRSLKAAQGLRTYADISLLIWKVPQLPGHSFVWLGQYILYCINQGLPPQIIMNLTHLDICHVLKSRIPPLNSNVHLTHYSNITY